jgi:fused signal recognition particle receptor
MVYAIIAIVLLLAVVYFVALRKPTDRKQPTLTDEKQAKSAMPAVKPKEAAAGAETRPQGEPAGKAAQAPPTEQPAAPAAAPAPAPEAAAPAPVLRDVAGLRSGLAKTRATEGFLGRLASLFAGKKQIDPAVADQVEEILLGSDVGVATTQAILERLRDGLRKNELSSADAVWTALRSEATRILSLPGGKLRIANKPTVVFVVGVNGVGKTTSIGKIATKLKADGVSAVLAAGDTFRAAAVQQLAVWGNRVGCEVVRGKEGADPGSVVFDAIQKAKQSGIDVVLADTAGRLQTKTPLMDELKKIARTMQKAADGAPHETLLVLDATNGQNAVSQARMFQEAIPLTGIILTKLDGTAKGGVILGICDELKIPVRYIGLGERAEDLRDFVAEEFVEALFGRNADEAAA